jgi:hypothetical protein
MGGVGKGEKDEASERRTAACSAGWETEPTPSPAHCHIYMLQKIEVHRGTGKCLTTKRKAGNKFIIVSENKKKREKNGKNRRGGKLQFFFIICIHIRGVQNAYVMTAFVCIQN